MKIKFKITNVVLGETVADEEREFNNITEQDVEHCWEAFIKGKAKPINKILDEKKNEDDLEGFLYYGVKYLGKNKPDTSDTIDITKRLRKAYENVYNQGDLGNEFLEIMDKLNKIKTHITQNLLDVILQHHQNVPVLVGMFKYCGASDHCTGIRITVPKPGCYAELFSKNAEIDFENGTALNYEKYKNQVIEKLGLDNATNEKRPLLQ
jgi:hypothetical protein